MIGVSFIRDLDPTPFAFTLTGLLLAVGLYRFKLFELVPVATESLVRNLPDGMLVIDGEQRILDFNPAARILLDNPPGLRIGAGAADILSPWPELNTLLGEEEPQDICIFPVGCDPVCWIEARLIQLFENQPTLAGRLVILRDITSLKQAEESERQARALAEALRDSAAALNSTLVFEEVLKHLLENAGRVVPHDTAAFVQVEGRQARLTRTFRRSEPIKVENLWKGPLQWQEHHLLVAADRSGKASIGGGQEKEWASLLEKDASSVIAAPVFVHEELSGLLLLGSQQEDFFNEIHAGRLQAINDQAAIAMQNARLYAETRSKAEQLSTLNQIGLAISSGLEMDQVLQNIYLQCLKAAEVDAFYIAIYDEKQNQISFPLFYYQGQPQRMASYNLDQQTGLTGSIVQSRKPLYLPDTQKAGSELTTQMLHLSGRRARSYLGVPIQHKEKVLGVISMQSFLPQAYTSEHLSFLETIASQAAIALENARLFSYVQHLAIIDELTQVYNYRGLKEFGIREVSRALRFKRQLSAIFFDIDHFRDFNNRFGHQTGNLILKAVADSVSEHLRSVNLFARYGGEEFVVLLPETGLNEAVLVAERLRQEVERLCVPTQFGQLGVTISVGVAEMDDSIRDLDGLLAFVSQKERLAKKNGRNRVEA
jgi:diguanylate cyclase (GGDEF)-like protein